ncbi:hypothetical protein BASA81_004908 [Batrachochytrium salamandrivorans]|nr:hypothetical protein BASA81_004908 [Batrachochytrium salamandrivorans]
MFRRFLLAPQAASGRRAVQARLLSSTASSMMDMFKSVGKYSEQKLKNAKLLLGQDEPAKEKPTSFIGHSHGDHAAMIERDLLKIVQNQGGGGHGHSHGDGHGHSHGDGHGHSHGEDEGHGHSHGKENLEDEERILWKCGTTRPPLGRSMVGQGARSPPGTARSGSAKAALRIFKPVLL